MSGFDVQKKQEAKVALAVSLGILINIIYFCDKYHNRLFLRCQTSQKPVQKLQINIRTKKTTKSIRRFEKKITTSWKKQRRSVYSEKEFF